VMDIATCVCVKDRVVFCVYIVYRQFIISINWISTWNSHCSKHIRTTSIWISCIGASYWIQLRLQWERWAYYCDV